MEKRLAAAHRRQVDQLARDMEEVTYRQNRSNLDEGRAPKFSIQPVTSVVPCCWKANVLTGSGPLHRPRGAVNNMSRSTCGQ
jgi:hypothetical protein